MTLGPLCQIEIHVTDLATSIRFYEQVLGWPLSLCEIHDYYILDVPKDQGYGVALIPVARTDDASKQNLVLYFRNDEPEKLLTKVDAMGGRRLAGPKRVMGYGDVYFFTDPNGVKFGLFKPAAQVSPA